MNERIRELLKQASKLANTDHNKDFDRNFDMIVAEKFAQLIVAECAQVSEDDITDGDACCTNTAARIARQIKKHFGVTE